ncbi:MAG: peptidylprolyl isomerase [Candidatus Zixiibacteriota bacterium]|nr:MAG: peptidylprolyl isomerase [candidate division Zixibacteria bacterium]
MKNLIIGAILLTFATALLPGCSGDRAVKSGDTVKVDYKVALEDGSVVDSSATGQPLQFTLGAGNIIPGVENAVIGMKVGDSKSVSIPPEEAYGPRRDDMIGNVRRSEFPQDMSLTVGQRLQMPQPNGGFIPVTVVAITDTMVTLDANHPLAGQTLNFDLQLVEIMEAAP